MKHAILPSSVLRCTVSGLSLAAPRDAAAVPATNSQAVPGETPGSHAIPAALQADFSRSVAVDPLTGSVFVALSTPSGDSILRFASASALHGGAEPGAILTLPARPVDQDGTNSQAAQMESPCLACDAEGCLWVSDPSRHRVLRFDHAATLPTGALPHGVLGQPDFTASARGLSASQMNFPGDIAVDAHGRLYVADRGNARILWFNKAARRAHGASANGVLGQADFDTRAPHSESWLSPSGLAVEGGRPGVPVTLWAADSSRERVLRFDNALTLPMAGAQPSAILPAGKTELE